MKYNVMIATYVYATAETREEAEVLLDEARHSYFALVHCRESFYIKAVQ